MAMEYTYKGYIGQVEFDEDTKLLHGTVINSKDVITFVGKTIEEACAEFRISVDDYLAFCEEMRAGTPL